MNSEQQFMGALCIIAAIGMIFLFGMFATGLVMKIFEIGWHA